MSEQLKQQIDATLDQLEADLAAGYSEHLTQYLSVMGRFHRYSVGNQLLIGMQKPEARRVAGFRSWQRLGRYVQPGERAIRILAPITRRKRADKNDRLAEQSEQELLEDRQLVGFRQACVFDISQTRGKSLPEPAQMQGEPGAMLNRLEAFIQDQGVHVQQQHLSCAEGISTGGLILLREGLPPAERFSVLVHEFAHEMLHHSEEDKATDKSTRETEAEAVAYVVCAGIGLTPGQACSDYVKLSGGDRQTLLKSLVRIRRTAGMILEALAEDQARAAA